MYKDKAAQQNNVWNQINVGISLVEVTKRAD